MAETSLLDDLYGGPGSGTSLLKDLYGEPPAKAPATPTTATGKRIQANAERPEAAPLTRRQKARAAEADAAFKRANTINPDGVGGEVVSRLSRGVSNFGAGFNRGVAPLLDAAGLPVIAERQRGIAAKQSEAAQRPIAGEVSVEQFLDNPSIVGALKAGGGTLLESTPEMLLLGSPLGLGASAVSRTGAIANDRANNNGEREANLRDLAIAAPFAAGSVALDRLGLDNVFKGGGKTALGRIISGTGGEALTEGAQSALEYTGGSLGTDQGFKADEFGRQVKIGAAGGALAGGGLAGSVEVANAPFSKRPTAPGERETKAAEAVVTPADEASPIPTELIAKGRAAVNDALGVQGADTILEAAGLPRTGKRVTINLPEGDALQGTIEDAFDTDAGDAGRATGVKIKLDDGTIMSEHFDDLKEAGITISENDPRAEADAIDARLAAAAGSAPIEAPASPQPRAAKQGGYDLASLKAKIRGPESGGNDNAVNRAGSSASGRYQFVEGTFKSLYAKVYGTNAAEAQQGWERERFDPVVQERLMDALVANNEAVLRRKGLPVNDGSMYAMHVLGEGDGPKLLAADPSLPADHLLSKQIVSQNAAYFKGKTVGQALAIIAGKVGASPATGAPLPVSRETEEGQAAPAAEEPMSANYQAAKKAEEQGDTEPGWERFLPDSGTLDIPRAEMPQIKAEDRSALVQFLAARGVANEQEEVPAAGLKATQAEFSPEKVQKAIDYEGGNRAILVSNDGYILDGHHQALAAAQTGDNVRTIKLDAPIRALLDVVNQFPSVTRADGATPAADPGRTEVVQSASQPGEAATEAAPSATQGQSGVTFEDMPSGASVVVRGVGRTEVERARLAAASPSGAAPLWNSKRKGWVVPKKNVDAIRAAFAAQPDIKVGEKLAGGVSVDDAATAARASAANNAQVKTSNTFAENANVSAKEETPDVRKPVDLRPTERATGDGISRTGGRADNAQDSEAVSQPLQATGQSDINDRAAGKDRDGRVSGEPSGSDTATEPKRGSEVTPAVQGREQRDVPGDNVPEVVSTRAEAREWLKELDHNTIRVKDSVLTLKDNGDSGWSVKVARDGESVNFTRGGTVLGAWSRGKAINEAIEEVFFYTSDELSGNTGQLPEASGNSEQLPAPDFAGAVNADLSNKQVDAVAAIFDRAEKRQSGYGANNKAFTSEAADKARAVLRAKMSQLNSAGFDPELAQAGMTLVGYHIEAGARAFIDAAKATAQDLGVSPVDLRNSLRSWYMAARVWMEDNSLDVRGMDDSDAVKVDLSRIDTWGKAEVTNAPEPATQAAGADLEIDNANDAKQRTVEGNREAGDVGRDAQGDAPSPRGGDAGSDTGGSRTGGAGNLSENDSRASGGDGADLGEADSGKPAAAKSGNRNRTQPGDRVPSGRKPERADRGVNYSAALGSLTREGSWRAAASRNLDIIELVNRISAERRPATAEEQQLLSKFVGWGAGEIRNNLFKNIGRNRDTGERVIQPPNYGEWREIGERAEKLLRGEDLETALQSVQYAHYTSEEVIRSIWEGVARLGFSGGKILEPGMGNGLFAVAAPRQLMQASSYTGIELDGFTSKVAGLLLPQEDIISGDFTKRLFPDGFFDLAIGNPPFAQVKVTDDPAYRKLRLSLHDYFFAKSIDKVRPGGLLVFVTSRYTMDKQEAKARDYIAERADLLGAIRLPQTAFKENAGTEVVTDVLFLQKRAAGVAPAGKAWTKLDTITRGDAKGKMINQYFIENPSMVLGSHAVTGSMYRADEYTVEPPAGKIETAFKKAIANLPEKAMFEAPAAASAELKTQSVEYDMVPTANKEGGVYLKDGALLVRDQGVGKPLTSLEKLSAKDQVWLKDYVPLRDAVKQAQKDQLLDGDWEKSLAALNKVYDAFVKKHGPVSAFTTSERASTDSEGKAVTQTYRRFSNRLRLAMDVEGTLVEALEKISDDGKISKGAFLNGRTLKKPARREIATATDAVAVSLDEIGKFDIAYVSKLLARPQEEVIAELGDEVFQLGDGSWIMADEYLSGDVVAKLDEAEIAAKADPRFTRNMEALIKVQPSPLAYSDISVKLGAAWIEPSVVELFAQEVLGESITGIRYEPLSATWSVPDSSSRYQRSSASEWGTADRTAKELLTALLNNRSIKITRTDSSGGKKTTYTDQEATALANERADKIADRFKSWIWTDGPRAQRLTEKYNRSFNNLAPRKFDGSHLTFPGLSTRYTLYPHQKRAIWRIIAQGSTYLDHAVGAGKTLEMIVAGMEQRRLGLITKPMYVVPNHMLNQFSREFLDAYPAANIMVADEKAFHTGNRRRFMAQAALNNPDAIIVSHSSFGKIAPSDAARQAVAQQFIEELEAAQESLESTDRVSRSKLESQIEQMKRRFEGKAGTEGKDKALTFEETGVDFLFIDEAHEFRKLDFATNRTAVKGIDPNGSQKALDMYIKTLTLAKARPGRSLVMASGTPVTNTMAEIFTVMRYMDQAGLERDGMQAFDAWASMFGEVVSGFEQNAAGGYEMVERFAKFVNVPELMSRVRKFMDVLTNDELGALVKRPAIKGGLPENVVAEASPELKEFMKVTLQDRIKVSRAWKPSKDQPGNPDPVINIITDGRLSAIDMRFMNPRLPNDPESKLNKMIDNIIETHKRFEDVTFIDNATAKPFAKKGATQIVFSAVGFGDQVAISRGFDARAWVNKRLADAGITSDAVAWMNDQNTHAKKETTFKAMRGAEKRILLGSPKNMGTGVNVQARLKALHFLSPPWYPSDIEQPHGRIVRQGNMNDEVELSWYATKGTYDSTAWGMVSRKQRFIEQAFRGDASIRSIEDISEANQYEMAAALAAGDERAIQLAGLSNEIERMTKLQTAHSDEQQSLRWKVKNGVLAIERMNDRRARLLGAIEVRGTNTEFKMIVGRTDYDKPGLAGDALIAAIDKALADFKGVDPASVEIARYQGTMPVMVEIDVQEYSRPDGTTFIANKFDVVVEVGPVKLDVADGLRSTENLDPVGFAGRVTRAVNKLTVDLAIAEREIVDTENEQRRANNKLGAPFEYQGQLGEKIAERARLQQELADETTAANEKDKQDGAPAAASAPEIVEDVAAPLKLRLGDAASIDTPLVQAEIDAAWLSLSARMKQYGIVDRIALRVVESIAANPKALGSFQAGQVTTGGTRYQGLIEVALNERSAESIFDHEAIHALRELGVFRPSEWTSLTKAAKADAAGMDRIRKLYEGMGLTEDELVEEAVAEMFAKWRQDGAARGFIKSAFERVKALLDALESWAKGNGWTTADQVMRAIVGGEIGASGNGDDRAAFIARAAQRFAIADGPAPTEFSPAPQPRDEGPRVATFKNPTTEKRFSEAKKGIASQATFRQRVAEKAERTWAGMTRHWIELPNDPVYASLQEKLRQIEAAPTVAKERGIRMLDDLIKGMSEADLDLFSRKVVLDDLAWSARFDKDLPFGLTKTSLAKEKANIDAMVEAQEGRIVWKAVMKRKMINRGIAEELVKAGVLEAGRIKNPAYFRHMVIDYARARQLVDGTGTKLRSPMWPKREDSLADINANLIEAEFDWLNKAFVDIKVASSIEWIKASEHNIMPALVKQAKEKNKAGVDAKLEAAQKALTDRASTDEDIAKAAAIIDQDKKFRQMIGMGFADVTGALRSGKIDVPPQFKAVAQGLLDKVEGNDPPFEFLSWIIDENAPGAMGAMTILKTATQRRLWTKMLLGKEYIDPTSADDLLRIAPEGYAKWTPSEALLFTVKTIPEHVIDNMLTKLDSPQGVDPNEFRGVLENARSTLASGSARNMMIVPEPVALTLDNLRRTPNENLFIELAKRPVQYWKRWVLINPRRYFKYNFNNITGDFDAIMAGNPKMLRFVGQAGRELAGVMRGKAKPTARYEEALERGVFDSGLTVQEIPDIHTLAPFEKYDPNRGEISKLALMPLRKAWGVLQGTTQWRENVFRYAAYLDYAERIEAGESQASIGYGASRPEMVDWVKDDKDRAALLARDLVGDYGAISHYGAGIRESVIPFWSWMEINTRRYWRLTLNAYSQGVGKGIATGGGLAIATGARKSALLAAQMAALYGLVTLWNGMLFADEEDELTDEQRRQLHILLGRNDNGEIVSLRAQGALSDALSWFGLSPAIDAFKDAELGRGSPFAVVGEVAKAPINKLGTALSPTISLPLESATGKKFWPDLFNVRENRDPWRNIAQSVSIENEYDALLDKPTRGYARSWQEALIYRRDPGEMAYNEARGVVYGWLEREKGRKFRGGISSESGDVLRDYRTALKFDDMTAADEALARMQDFDIDQGKLNASIKQAHPLGPLAKKDHQQFVDQLTTEEYETFQRAEIWYNQTFLGR